MAKPSPRPQADPPRVHEGFIPPATPGGIPLLSTYEHKYAYIYGLHRRYHVRMNPKKPRLPCIVCGREPARSGYTYCSNACQHEFQYQAYIRRWKNGAEEGLNSIGLVTGPVKKYLREKHGNKCCLCGWSQTNPKTGVVPLVADHIDGNWQNNIEENLRLVCPNCDALSLTFAALNKGNGRAHRAPSKRASEGRRLAKIRKIGNVGLLPE